MLNDERSSEILRIQVECGHPCCPLQSSGSCLKMIQLASAVMSIRATCPKKERWQDLTIAESGGCWVIWQIWSFLTKSTQRTSKILCKHHSPTASIWRPSAFVTVQHPDPAVETEYRYCIVLAEARILDHLIWRSRDCKEECLTYRTYNNL